MHLMGKNYKSNIIAHKYKPNKCKKTRIYKELNKCEVFKKRVMSSKVLLFWEMGGHFVTSILIKIKLEKGKQISNFYNSVEFRCLQKQFSAGFIVQVYDCATPCREKNYESRKCTQLMHTTAHMNLYGPADFTTTWIYLTLYIF